MNCTYCALGYVLIVNNTQNYTNQTCQTCNSSCSRCMPNNTNVCTACFPPYYLAPDYTCRACFSGCAYCSSQNICLACNPGYVPIDLPIIYLFYYNNEFGFNCAPCMSPCQTCIASPQTCNTCI